MSFTVELSPAVLDALSTLPQPLRDFVPEIRGILSSSPYKFHALIYKNFDAQGRVFYQSFDGIIPLVFLYRVYPPEEEWHEGEPGYVYVARAERAWW